MSVAPVGGGLVDAPLSKDNAIGWQPNKSSIVLNAQIFHVKI
jgi:hypothetical protein